MRIGALSDKMADYGISDDSIKKVRARVTEGTSALFLMTSDTVQDKVVDECKRYGFELIASNLAADQEDQLGAAEMGAAEALHVTAEMVEEVAE